MTDACNEYLDALEKMRQRVNELERVLEQRDAAVLQCAAVIKKLRERVGNGFRGEVRAFSESIKGLVQ